MLRATHLAKVKSEVYERSWERFFVQRPARLVAVRPCLTGISMRSAEIVDISRGGASFVVATTVGLPSHYYLNILGLAYRIACAETSRNGNRIHILGGDSRVTQWDLRECLDRLANRVAIGRFHRVFAHEGQRVRGLVFH